MRIEDGRTAIEFDWFEEEDACWECSPEVDRQEEMLVWRCDENSVGSAKLFAVVAS